MKRIYKFFVVLFVCLCVFTLASCGKDKGKDNGQNNGNNNQATHEHAYVVKNVADTYKASDATCTQPAKYYYSCSCGEKGTETFNNGEALGHNAILDPASKYLESAATCTAPAYYHYICEKCGAKLEETYPVGTPIPHTFDQLLLSDETKAADATCTEAVKYYYSCKCGEIGTVSVEVGYPLGHDYSDVWYVDETNIPTEEKTGKLLCACQRNGCTAVEEVIIPALNATNYALKVTDPTCCATGSKEYTYSYNGQEFKFNVTIEALGHDMQDVEAQTATCTQIGWDAYQQCARCGEKEGYNEYEILPHTFEELVVDAQLASAATCTTCAVYYKSCSCGERMSGSDNTFEYGTALGHDISPITGCCTREGCDYSISTTIDISANAVANWNYIQYPRTVTTDTTNPNYDKCTFQPHEDKYYSIIIDSNSNKRTLMLYCACPSIKLYDDEGNLISATWKYGPITSVRSTGNVVEYYYFYENLENGTYHAVCSNTYDYIITSTYLLTVISPFVGITLVKAPTVYKSCEVVYNDYCIYDGYGPGDGTNDYVLQPFYKVGSGIAPLQLVQKSKVQKAGTGEHTYVYQAPEECYGGIVTRKECYVCATCGHYFDMNYKEVELESLYMGDFYMKVYTGWVQPSRGFVVSGQVICNDGEYDLTINDVSTPESLLGKTVTVVFDDGFTVTGPCTGVFATEEHPDLPSVLIGRLVSDEGYGDGHGNFTIDYAHTGYNVVAVYISGHTHDFTNDYRCECGAIDPKLISHASPCPQIVGNSTASKYDDGDTVRHVYAIDLPGFYNNDDKHAIEISLVFTSDYYYYNDLVDGKDTISNAIKGINYYFEDGSSVDVESEEPFVSYCTNIDFPSSHKLLIIEVEIDANYVDEPIIAGYFIKTVSSSIELK